MIERNPEDVVRGALRIWVGGGEKKVPTLKIRASEAWVLVAAEKIGPLTLSLAAEESPEVLGSFAVLTQNAILDLVVAYDTTGALGGRQWLEDNADPLEVFTALRQMARVALPFVDGVGIVMEVLARMERLVLSLKSLTSTSGPSPTGASAAKRSKRGSIASR